MLPYGNRAGKSGIVAYQIGAESIEVEFSSGWIYLFNYETPGALRVERMKELAQSGRGLATFISKYVKERHGSKRRREA